MSKKPMYPISGMIGKAVLALKLRSPVGITLTNKESDLVIDGWESEIKDQDKSAKALVTVSQRTETQLKSIDKSILDTARTFKVAKGYFLKTKDPVKKDVWARRLVLAGRAHEQLRQTDKRLKATINRAKSAVEDAKLVKLMLQTRIDEARIYKEMNGGLKLVGQALVDARQEYSVYKPEYKNLEFNMEALEKTITKKDRKSIIEEAEKYLDL